MWKNQPRSPVQQGTYTQYIGSIPPPRMQSSPQRIITFLVGNPNLNLYKLRDLEPEAKVVVHILAQQNIIWNRFLKWAHSNGVVLWKSENLTSTNCLRPIGYSLRSPAIFQSTNMNMWQSSLLFHTGGGKIRTLNIAFQNSIITSSYFVATLWCIHATLGCATVGLPNTGKTSTLRWKG